jgi:hypothetical protein
MPKKERSAEKQFALWLGKAGSLEQSLNNIYPLSDLHHSAYGSEVGSSSIKFLPTGGNVPFLNPGFHLETSESLTLLHLIPHLHRHVCDRWCNSKEHSLYWRREFLFHDCIQRQGTGYSFIGKDSAVCGHDGRSWSAWRPQGCVYGKLRSAVAFILLRIHTKVMLPLPFAFR